jgi:hypothetical protein
MLGLALSPFTPDGMEILLDATHRSAHGRFCYRSRLKAFANHVSLMLTRSTAGNRSSELARQQFGGLPLLLGRHLARRPHCSGVHLLSRTSLIREPCFLSPRVLGPPLGPFEPLTCLQGIGLCSLEVHQLHLAATFQIIAHGTPLPTFLRGELCHQTAE